jgi:uncharacterized protein YndB with AHSA1/START domain
MFKLIGITAAGAVAAVLVTAAFQPSRFEVRRTTTINAPPDRIYALLTDFRRWDQWSPYERLDPAMQRRYSGSSRGAGAVYEWEGNARAGKGRMEITEAHGPSEVAIQLDFQKPLEAHNVASFTLEPRGRSTAVTWSMRGPTPYVGKVIHLFFDMDRVVGEDFEAGLANLKAVAERGGGTTQ